MKKLYNQLSLKRLFKGLFFIVFFLLISNSLWSQTYNLRFEKVSNNGTTLVVKVQMSLSSVENLGTSNLVFTYDGAEMSNPVLGTVHNFNTGNYQAMTLTSPAANTVSLNIELNTDDAGTALATGASFTDVAEVSFTLNDETGTANFQWQEATTTKTVVYQDDNATLLAKGTLTNNDMSLDATAPATPGTPDLATSSDSGSEEATAGATSDNLTNDLTPTFEGTGVEASATIEVFSSVTGSLGTTGADGSGNWSFTSGVLAAGTHNITATAKDAANNTSGASSALAITIKTSQPTVAVTTTSTNPTNDNPIPITITFSEEADGFRESDITFTNATIGDFASADSTAFTANLTPSGNGAVTVDVNAAVATDQAGNNNTAASQFAITYDGVAPTVTSIVRQTPTDATTNATSAVFRVTFSEDVNNVGTADFAISGAGAGGTASITGVSEETASTVFDVTVSTINTNGELDLDFAGGQDITDDAGNAFAGTITTEEVYTIDQSAPTFNSAGSTPNDNATGVATANDIEVAFSENIAQGTGFITIRDVTAGGNFESFDITTATATASPAAGALGIMNEKLYINPNSVLTEQNDYSIRIDATAITDATGNSFAGIVSDDVTFNFSTADETNPTLTNQALAQTAADALRVTYQSTETGTLYYVVTTNSSTPTQAQIKAGNDQSGTSTNVVSNGNAAVTVTGSNQTVNLTSLTLATTTYHVFLYQEDASSNESSVVTNSAAVDATAPTLQSSAPTDNDANVTLSQNLSLTFDDNMVVGTGNITIVETGVGTFEALDVTNGSLVSISTTTVTLDPSGTLKKGTAYHILIDATVLDDDAGNDFAGISDATDLNFTTVDVVINEVVTDPQQDWSTSAFNGTVGAGAVTDGTDEWVELFIKSAGIDLAGWTIELNDGTDVTGDLTSSGAFDVSNYTTAGSGTFNNTESGDYLVLGNVDGSGAMNNTGLTINLKDPGGAIVDAVTIGGGGGEAPSGNTTSESDESVQRIPNGTDTDADDSDFVNAAASMGAVNDNTPPTFESSTPSTSSVGQTTFTLSTDIDESGTVYYVIVADAATAPTSAEVKAGTSSGGGAALDDGSQAVSSGGFTHGFSVTGLTASTAYDIYVVAEDDNGNLQSAPTLVNESTIANPTIAFSSTTSSGAESVTSADLEVALSATNDQNVTVNFTVVGTATGGGTDYTLADGSITITASNTTNDITIASIIGDDIVEANETVIVTLSGPTNATLGTNTQHTYVINNDDVAGFTITETAGATATGENGTTDTYTVELDAEPASDVVIDVTSGDTGEGSVDKASLTFTAANWDTPQTVTVTGQDDDLIDGTQNYDITLSINDGSSNDFFDPLANQTVDVDNTDDEVAGFTVAETAGTTATTEAGATDTYTVVLDAEPNSDVVIDVTSDDTGEVQVDKATLTFTTANWDTPQTVTVTGQDDDIIDGTQTATITMSIDAASTDNNFDGVANETVSVDNTDDDVAGFTVTETAGTTATTEAGTTDTYTVVLDAEPNSNVVIDVTSDDTGEVQVNLSSLTFTTANWDTPQTVTVTGQDDDIIDGTQTATITMSVDAASTDDNFDGVANETVSVDNTDDDTAGFTVTESGGTTTTEAGTTDSYTVVLDAEPNSNVVIDVSSDDTGEVTVSTSSLTFTTANWDTPQTVTVTGQDDALIDGTQTATITMSIDAASTDDNFDGVANETVSVNNTDDDTPGITIVETAGATATGENGTTDTYTVVLDAEPTSNVVINVTSGDTGEGTVDQSSLTFTTANWDTPQTVTVTGQDDDIIDGTQNFDITLSIDDASSDDDYDPVADVTLDVDNSDDDVAGFTVAETAGTTATTEAGGTDTYTVVLDAEPNSNVVIDVSSNDTGEAIVDQSSLTFTTANWDTPQTVTVTGQDDDIIDGTQTATITMSIDAASTDNNFDGVANETVSADNTDDDVAGFTVTETAGTTATTEAGTTDTYTVVLDAEPNSNVVIDVTSDDTGEVQVNLSSLTFTTANWDTPQTVTVTGQDDDIIDGTQTATITMSVDAASTDDNFDGVANETVSVDNTDDDVAGFSVTETAGTTATTEAGTTDTYTVVLDAEPNSNVVIDVSSDDTGEVQVDQSSLTFTTANWDTPQTVTVTGQDDDIIDGIQTATITMSIDAASTDDNFDGVANETVSVDNSDDDVAGFTIVETGGATATGENGTTDTYTVVLDAEPTSNVVIDVTSGDTGEGAVDQSSLTFTTANWDTHQTVTVTGQDDDIIDGTQNFDITLSIDDASSDDDFDPVVDQTVNVDNTDDDVAGFTIVESAGTTATNESGTTDDFTVVLDAEPNSDVVITVSVDDVTEGSVDQSSLTFTAANWDTPQTVTVTGLDDGIFDGNVAYNITMSIDDSGSDDNFDPLANQTVSVTNIDDEIADPVVSTPGAAVFVNAATQTISGTHSEDGVTVHAYADSNNDGVADNASSLGSSAVAGGNWSFSVALTADAANNFVVTAIDSDNNESNDIDVPTITEDSTNPTLSSTSPADDATNAGISGDITLTFSENIAFGTGNIKILDFDDNTSSVTIDAASPGSQASISGNVLTLSPTNALELNTNFIVQVDATAIDDGAGNSFAGIADLTTFNFTTVNTSVAFSSTSSNGAESTSSANLEVSLNAASASTVTVDYAVTGTATGTGTDYTLADGTLTFNSGDVTKNITIASIVADVLDENNETVIVTLSNPTNAGLGTNTQHTYTINDDDPTPTVAFNATASNGAESVTSANLQVDLSAVSGLDVTVDYAVTGTATGSGTDYTLANGTLTFTAGSSLENITIASIVGDVLDEADETVIVTLSNPNNATLGTNTVHTYTINDDDATPTVAFNSTSSNGAETTTSATLQVDLSAVSGQDVMVDYAVTGTASGSGTDYTLANGTLTFTAGSNLENITIASIIGDALDEDDETVIVTLSSPTNATLGTNTQHTYTILDDDVTPTIAFTATSSDNDESVSSANLQVALSAVSGRDVSVNYTVIGTATDGGTDYTLADGTLTITESNSSNNITIASIVDDLLDEDNETVIVTLSSPTNGVLGTNTQHTYTINDNDALPTVAFGLATDGQLESEPSQDIQVSLSAVSGKTVTVDYAVSGTATAGGTDHTTTGGTITFNAGDQNFQQQIVGIVDDLLDEENETIILTLSNPSNATLGTQTTHTYTITDNDDAPTVTLSADNTTIAENGGTSTLTATLSAVSGKDVTVTLGYTGSATNGTDYNSNAGTSIVITAGTTSNTASPIVTSIDDADGEGNETIIVDITGITNGTEATPQTVTMTITDDDAAVVTSVASNTANGNYKAGDLIAIQITFNQAVNVTGTPQLTLETGTTDQIADYASGDGTTTLTFNYTVQAGDVSADLDYVDANSLTLNGGTIIGNSLSAILDLATPGDANSLGANAAVIIDTSAPADPVVTTPASDILLNAANQTVSGTHGEDGVTINLYADSDNNGVADNATVLASATVTGNAWSLTANLTGDAANNFVVQAADAAGNTSAEVNVPTVTEDSTSPVISSDGSAATASLNVNENSSAVTTVTATDANTVTYTISGGADQALFSISAGVLTFTAAPDFENPGDADTNNTYIVEVTASDGINTDDTQTITVTVVDQDDNSPVITSDGGGVTTTVNVNENTTAVTTVTATDADGVSTVAYSISGGADQALFSMAAGVLTFTNAPDFENPGDADTNNTYVVEVTATDGNTTADTQTITVTVVDQDDNSPVITSDGGGATAALNVNENAMAVTTVTATDADGVSTVAYSISGGADQALFSMAAGVLTFTNASDFENPGDADTDNAYVVEVTATDGNTTADTQTITVTIVDQDDNSPVITSDGGGATAALNVNENATAVTTVTATDADGVSTVAYSISGGADQALFSMAAGVLTFTNAPDFESPGDADTDNAYVVEVTATDGTTTADTQTITITVGDLNDNTPVITASQSFSIDETVANSTSVGTVAATDQDAATTFSSWTITGGNGAGIFAINAATGEVTIADNTSLSPKDVTASHTLTLTVSDGANTSATETVAINILDSTAPASPAVISISEDTGSSATDQITNDQTLSFTGTAEANSMVEVFIDGSSIGTVMTDGTGDFTFDHSGVTLTQATYAITATATDASANTSAQGAAQAVVVDTTPPIKPAITSISDDTGVSNTDLITNDPSLIFFGSAEPFSNIELKITGVTFGRATADVNGNWTVDFTRRDFPEGPSTLTAISLDVAGNISASSDDFILTVDLGQPSINSLNRADANPTSATTVDYIATFSEEVAGISTGNFELAFTGTQSADIASVSSSSGTSITITVNNIAGEGSFGLILSDITGITDVAGNALKSTFNGEIYNTNFTPTNISLSSTSITENNSVGDVIGALSTSDTDAGDTHTYTLVAGTGDTDNASFSINANQLQAAAVFDLETKASYNIRLQTDDGRGGTFQEAFIITIDNVPEADLRITGNNDIPATPLGITSNFDITVHNDGDATLTITSILYPTAFGGPVSGINIAAGGSQVVTMNFTPTIAQLYTGNITIVTNGGTGILAVSADGAIITGNDDGLLSAEAINIYPNPASDVVTVDLSKFNGRPLDIQLFDLSGTKAFDVTDFRETTLKLDIKGYQQGIYLMYFTDGKSTVQKKIMISK